MIACKRVPLNNEKYLIHYVFCCLKRGRPTLNRLRRFPSQITNWWCSEGYSKKVSRFLRSKSYEILIQRGLVTRLPSTGPELVCMTKSCAIVCDKRNNKTAIKVLILGECFCYDLSRPSLTCKFVIVVYVHTRNNIMISLQ